MHVLTLFHLAVLGAALPNYSGSTQPGHLGNDNNGIKKVSLGDSTHFSPKSFTALDDTFRAIELVGRQLLELFVGNPGHPAHKIDAAGVIQSIMSVYPKIVTKFLSSTLEESTAVVTSPPKYFSGQSKSGKKSSSNGTELQAVSRRSEDPIADLWTELMATNSTDTLQPSTISTLGAASLGMAMAPVLWLVALPMVYMDPTPGPGRLSGKPKIAQEIERLKDDIKIILSGKNDTIQRQLCQADDKVFNVARSALADIKKHPLQALAVFGVAAMGSLLFSTVATVAGPGMMAFDTGPYNVLDATHGYMQMMGGLTRLDPDACKRPTAPQKRSLVIGENVEPDFALAHELASQDPVGYTLEALAFGVGEPGAMYIAENGVEAFRNSSKDLKPATISMIMDTFFDRKDSVGKNYTDQQFQNRIDEIYQDPTGFTRKRIEYTAGMVTAVPRLLGSKQFASKLQKFTSKVSVDSKTRSEWMSRYSSRYQSSRSPTSKPSQGLGIIKGISW